MSDVLKSVLPAVPWWLRHEAGDTALPRWLGVLGLLAAGVSLALAQAPGDAGRTPGGPQDPVYAVGGWKTGEPQAEVKQSQLSLDVDEIDTDDGTARVTGTSGPVHVTALLTVSSAGAALLAE